MSFFNENTLAEKTQQTKDTPKKKKEDDDDDSENDIEK